MAHELAGALQQSGRIRQRFAVKEPHVYVRSEYVDVACYFYNYVAYF